MSGSYYQEILDKLDALVKSRFIEMFGTVGFNEKHIPIKKWNEVLEIRNGKDYKIVQNDNGKYPVYGSGGVLAYADEFICPEDTVIIGRKGTIDNPILVKEKFWNVDTAFGLVANKKIIDPVYLYWYCKFYDFKQHNKATTLPSLTKADLQKIEMMVPSIKEQKVFSSFVQRVDKSKFIAKQCLEKYNQLVKSRFIEMFGDVLTNSKGFESVRFGEYVSQMNIGPFGSDLRNECFVPESEGYCMVYEQKHAIDKDFTVEKRFVSKEKYEQMKRFDVGPGDILVSCRGTIGKCVIIPSDAKHGIIHPSLMMIKPKNGVNRIFLLSLLERILEVQSEKGSGVKMAIKATELSKLKTIMPSVELQDNYVMFLKLVNKSKFSMKE